MTDREKELKRLIVERLELDDETADSLAGDTLLFGGDAVLDSIDALEIELMLQERWGIVVRPSERSRSTFATISALAAFVEGNMYRDRKEAG
jgi:acyl carrier protein